MAKEEGKLFKIIEERKPILVEKETINPPKIYDCFMFFNEFDLLEIRLNELKDVVDKFVIVDCNCTLTGRPKDYWLEPLLDTRFSEFRNKIEYIKMDASQTPLCDWKTWRNTDNIFWGAEATQRNYSMRYLSEVCNDDDIIISGDADEIPNIEAVKSYKKENGFSLLVEKTFYFYFNTTNFEEWPCQKIGTWKDFKNSSFSKMRDCGSAQSFISNGGWHFSYCGGVDKIIKKIESFAHAEFNTNAVKDRDRIKEAMKSGKDVVGRESQSLYVVVEINETFPKYLRDNIEKFDRLGYIKHLDGSDNYSKNELGKHIKQKEHSLQYWVV
jgi:beta-1,4-mannosyl-glycoprotein beta-1,4-N-acetylglucosaminyltransferase